MGLLSSLSPWDTDTYGNNVTTLRVLIECERGSTCKYEYDDENNVMVVVRELDESFPYPFAYGCIPQTLADDGDSLDAIVVTKETVRSGTVVPCYPIAIVHMIDNGEGDDKLICTPYYLHEGLIDIKQIYTYLQQYKFPYQKGTVLTSIEGAEAAIKAVTEAHENFRRAHR